MKAVYDIRYIPNVGIKDSQCGNKQFPMWEQTVPSGETKSFQHGNNSLAKRETLFLCQQNGLSLSEKRHVTEKGLNWEEKDETRYTRPATLQTCILTVPTKPDWEASGTLVKH